MGFKFHSAELVIPECQHNKEIYGHNFKTNVNLNLILEHCLKAFLANLNIMQGNFIVTP
jgi:hypothetical protein